MHGIGIPRGPRIELAVQIQTVKPLHETEFNFSHLFCLMVVGVIHTHAIHTSGLQNCLLSLDQNYLNFHTSSKSTSTILRVSYFASIFFFINIALRLFHTLVKYVLKKILTGSWAFLLSKIKVYETNSFLLCIHRSRLNFSIRIRLVLRRDSVGERVEFSTMASVFNCVVSVYVFVCVRVW